MKTPLWICLTAALVAALPVAAGVFRCTINGQVVYQDAPCAGALGAAVKLNANAAPPPLVEQLRAQSQALRDLSLIHI